MALTSEATTLWFGDLQCGSGTTSLDSSDAAEFPVSWQARSVGEVGKTNPEELLGAAHSACYSMALSNALGGNGTPPESLQVTAAVTFVPGEGIRAATCWSAPRFRDHPRMNSRSSPRRRKPTVRCPRRWRASRSLSKPASPRACLPTPAELGDTP